MGAVKLAPDHLTVILGVRKTHELSGTLMVNSHGVNFLVEVSKESLVFLATSEIIF